MTDEVETDEGDRFAFAVDRGEILDSRGEIERVWELGEMAEEVFSKAPRRRKNEIGFASQ